MVLAELLTGLELEPPSQKRSARERHLDHIFELFVGRILPFDEGAARAYPTIVATRRRAGRVISVPDAQIAAVCLVHDATLATRNVRDFAGCGIRVVNPWAAG
ncbi:MAG: PIN domain-containing protein [Protaetiibacter sp.]